MAQTRPRTTRALRGSALGLGLLVVAGATATPALAMQDGSDDLESKAAVPGVSGATAVPLNDAPTPRAVTGTIAADFGRGKSLEVQVVPTGEFPEDLDLSGAEFLATQTDAAEGETPATGTCTTDQFGTCSFDNDEDLTVEARFPGTDDDLPTGVYSLVQVSSSPGLDAIGGAAEFEICDFDFTSSCPSVARGGDVPNASLFRTEITTVVTDAVTGAPLAGATYELTGPDYPHQDPDTTPPELPGEVERRVPSGEETTPQEGGSTAPESSTEVPETTTSAPTTTVPPTTTAPETTTEEAPTTTEESTSSSSPSSAEETVVPVRGLGPVLRAYGETVGFDEETSGTDGSLTFEGWFLPETGYTLTPVTGVDGYLADTVYSFGVQTTSAQSAAGESFRVDRQLVPVAAPSTSAAPTTAPTTTAAAPAGTRPGGSALATTGSPVETMTLVGLGMLALGGAATATGTVLRRRARQHS